MAEQVWNNQQTISVALYKKLKDIRHNLEKETTSKDFIHNERLTPELKTLQRMKENIIQNYQTKLLHTEQQINLNTQKKLDPTNNKKEHINNKKQSLEDELDAKLEQLQTQYDSKVSALKLHYEGRIKLLEHRNANVTLEEEENNRKYDKNIAYYTADRTRFEILRDNELTQIDEKIAKLEQREPSKLELTLKCDLERAENEYHKSKLLEHQYEADFERELKNRRAEAYAKEVERIKQMEADELRNRGTQHQSDWDDYNREKEIRRQRNKENIEKENAEKNNLKKIPKE
jgi:hypothetical protein